MTFEELRKGVDSLVGRAEDELAGVLSELLDDQGSLENAMIAADEAGAICRQLERVIGSYEAPSTSNREDRR